MSAGDPRLLLRGGYVHTPADPHATALCVEDGAIVWIGRRRRRRRSPTTPTGWSTSTAGWSRPAFVDAHVHTAADRVRR